MGSSAGLTLTPSRSDLSETALCWALAKRGCWEVPLPFRPGGRSMGKPLPWLRRCPLPSLPRLLGGGESADSQTQSLGPGGGDGGRWCWEGGKGGTGEGSEGGRGAEGEAG